VVSRTVILSPQEVNDHAFCVSVSRAFWGERYLANSI